MAIVLTSLLFVFEISIMPKSRVNYYDYTILSGVTEGSSQMNIWPAAQTSPGPLGGA